MSNDKKVTTIQITKATLQRLKARGKYGDRYDDIIIRLLDMTEKEKDKQI